MSIYKIVEVDPVDSYTEKGAKLHVQGFQESQKHFL